MTAQHWRLILTVAAWGTTAMLLPAETASSEHSVAHWQPAHDTVAARISAGRLAGAVTMVARGNRIIYSDSQGLRDIATGQPMRPDAIFRFCSMTKPVVAVAVLMMVDAGKLRIDEPISDFLPEFKYLRVRSVSSDGTEEITVPAAREITIRDLLTHTSGLGSGPGGIAAIKQLRRSQRWILADFIPRLASVPLDFQPGTRWHYSASAGFDILGRIVEIASDCPLDQFLARRLFEPLGMKDTTFALSAEQRTRLVTNYETTDRGLIQVPDQDEPLDPEYFSGSGGLAGTAADYLQFARMLANEGELNGRRLLSLQMVEAMRSIQIPDTLPGRPRGEAWGLGVRVVVGGSPLPSGAFGWSGAYGTHFWIDPREHLVAVLMLQLHNAGGSGAPTAREFEAVVMQSIEEK